MKRRFRSFGLLPFSFLRFLINEGLGAFLLFVNISFFFLSWVK